MKVTFDNGKIQIPNGWRQLGGEELVREGDRLRGTLNNGEYVWNPVGRAAIGNKSSMFWAIIRMTQAPEVSCPVCSWQGTLLDLAHNLADHPICPNCGFDRLFDHWEDKDIPKTEGEVW